MTQDSDARRLGVSFPLRLTLQQMERVHEASLEIMARTGMRFFDQEALELFKKAGASITDGNLVRIPANRVEWALRTAPKNITIFDRNRRPVMELGGYRCYYGVGSDCASLYDPYSGKHRRAVLDDVVKGVRLVDALPHIDFAMSMVLPSDVPLGKHEPHQMAIMLCETSKPIVFVGETEGSTICAIEMAAAVAGGLESLQQFPFIINFVNAKTSFHHNAESVRRLLYAAERNVPSIYSPATARGTSAPMTPAGALALGNAGQLAGLVLAQLKREGSPFIRGNPSGHAMDMRTMVDLYVAPDDGPLGWDLAHYYEIPIFGTAGCSDAKIFDAQAAGEATMTLLTNTISGANLIHDIGYLDCAMTYSFELLVYCDELIGWLKRYMRPPEITDETLALDLIDQVGPDGFFLDAAHTLKHVRDDWQPTLFDRFDYHRWAERGAVTLSERANQKVREILETHRPRPLPGEIVGAVESVRDKYLAED